jgi:hypothetical protein
MLLLLPSTYSQKICRACYQLLRAAAAAAAVAAAAQRYFAQQLTASDCLSGCTAQAANSPQSQHATARNLANVRCACKQRARHTAKQQQPGQAAVKCCEAVHHKLKLQIAAPLYAHRERGHVRCCSRFLPLLTDLLVAAVASITVRCAHHLPK